MGYKIIYNSKDQFYLMVNDKFQKWNTQLDRIENRINAIVNLDSFQGEAADSIKAYLQDVYTLILISVRQTLADYLIRLTRYSEGYYDIDPDIYAVLPQEALDELNRLPSPERSYLEAQDTAISNALNGIRDILPLSIPPQSDINAAFTNFSEKLSGLDAQITEYESINQSVVNGELASLISSLSAAINTFTQSRGGIKGYQSGDYAKRPEVLTLYQNVSNSMEYVQNNMDEILEASENLQEVYVQKQKDYEEALRAQQAEERKDQGVATMIVGGFAIVGGVAAIVLTAGMATPVVVTAAVSGTCATAYGVSKVAEGGQDYYYGSIGDIETAAWNPIRDTVFAGNQGAYDAWGSISLTVASLCVPVGKAVNTVAGSSSTIIAKKVAVTVGKEMVQDFAVGKVSDVITDHVADELDLNKTQTVILKTVTEKVLDKTADKVIDAGTDVYVKHRDGYADGKFVEKMSYEDAKRYNKFMDDTDPTRNSADVDTLHDIDADMSTDGIKAQVDKINAETDRVNAEVQAELDRIETDKVAEIDRINTERDAAIERIEAETEAELERIKAETEKVDAQIQEQAGKFEMYTDEQKEILRDMDENGEFIEEVRKKNGEVVEIDHGPVDVEKADAPKDPRNRLPTGEKGTIIGDRESGTFEYIPDDEKARAIMAEYDQDTVKYNNTRVEFSPFANHETPWGKTNCEVEVGHMTGERNNTADVQGNYSQADAALAEKISRETGKTVTQGEVKIYREENGLTWHEVEDAKTMQLIPTEINDSCPHRGGVSEAKYRQSWGDVSKDFT